MAVARMPAAFFKLAAHHLPPEQPVGPTGGRPCVSHRVVLKVLWFVLATGCRWEVTVQRNSQSSAAAPRADC